MHSSISNSNSRAPDKPYLKIGSATVILFFALAIGSEVYWSQKGFLPSVEDTRELWSTHRDNVYQDSHKKIVLIGLSRSQIGIDPDQLSRHFQGYKAVQLSLIGDPAWLVAKELSDDPNFKGILIWSGPATSFRPIVERKRPVFKFVEYYKNDFNIERKINARITSRLQGTLTILSPQLRFPEILRTGFAPQPVFYHMNESRFRPSRYRERLSKAELQRRRKLRIITLLETFQKTDLQQYQQRTVPALKDIARKIRSRGGDIILLRMPNQDEFWALDNAQTPKSECWDQLETWTGIKTIHFKDYPELSAFDCPDMSHLDATDVPQFTEALAKIIDTKLQLNTQSK